MNVHILSDSEGTILLTDAEPIGLWEFKLPDSSCITGTGSFGELLLQETLGDQYSVWYNNYQVKRGDRLTIISHVPTYRLQFALQNSFNYYDTTGTISPMHERGYNFVFTPGYQERVSFKDRTYSSLEIHFTKEYLCEFADGFAHLAEWLQITERPALSRLCKVNQVATTGMMHCIQELLHSPYTGTPRKLQYDALVRELLILVLQETAARPLKKIIRFTTREVESMYDLKRYLVANVEKPLDLAVISEMYGITPRTLKRRFQTLFGAKLYNFLLDIRMKQAGMLLQETDTSIENIAVLTGYQSFANFSTAFKKYYGHPPKYFRSR
ncbi:helix-turn-helix transcriptional regulator [Paraflavitalea pollutisoli]|uniref:helix-turn-helix transcriptional regulator n=1 Tax=Paraflavitalea pollutisoli TaxID=3034143 RepID=UPI0023ED8E81|nr:helix-turn-helix transcriptional regulator [Paraflavitalea sp. H1-2-19X]